MRVVQLDILRCGAVVLVLGRHMAPCPFGTNRVLWALTSVWQRGGWVGVDLFFVLSGFLVSGLLFREYQRRKAIDIKRFLIRRAFKIYPAFWAMLGVTVAIRLWTDGTVPTRPLLGELLFLQNYLGGLWNHTWSLAVEEHFYILLALLTVWLCHRPLKRDNPFDILPSLFIAVAIVCFGLRLRTALSLPYDHFTHLFPTHLRIDSLLFGVLLSYGWHFKGLGGSKALSRGAPWLFIAGLILLAPAFIFPLERTPAIPVVGLIAFYVGSGAILLAMLHITVPDSRVARFLAVIGTFSYSIYLWHVPFGSWGVSLVTRLAGAPLSWYASTTVYLVGALVWGIVAAKLVEYPALRIRDRFFPSASGLAVSTVAPNPGSR